MDPCPPDVDGGDRPCWTAAHDRLVSAADPGVGLAAAARAARAARRRARDRAGRLRPEAPARRGSGRARRPGQSPAPNAPRIPPAKAGAIARPGRWVLPADTTVTIDGAILGKAESP